MAVVRAEDIYERYVKLLPATERLRLLAIVAQDLAAEPIEVAVQSRRRWSDIRGIAASPLLGEDAQAWVLRTRREDDVHREQLRDQKP